MIKKLHLIMLLILTSLLFTAIIVYNQSEKKKEDKTPQIHFNVDVILRMIDVVVLDSDGNHVENLKPSDFEVYEEGTLQKIASFDNISYKLANRLKTVEDLKNAADKGESKPEEAKKEEQKTTEEKEVSAPTTTIGKTLPSSPNASGRSIVLLFDNYNTHYSHLVVAKKAAKQFITDDLLPEDRVAIIKYYGSAKVLQDFTDDKGKLFAAIDTLSVSLGEAVGKPEIADYRKTDLSSSYGYQNSSSQWDRSYQPYEVDKNWDRNEKVYNVTNFVDVLRTIGYALKDIQGRKTIIFLSPGFLGVNPVTSPWLFVSMGRVLERLSGYNITIYSVDVSGVATDQTGKRDERWDFLTYVSDKTGGRLFKNRNDLHGQLQKVNYEISHYYMIGYYSQDAYKDGRFIDVKVKCKKPGTTVRTVKGVYATRAWDKIPVEERKNNLRRLLDQSGYYVQVPIKIEDTSALPYEGGMIIYPLMVRFPIFQFYEDYDYLTYDLYLVISDNENNVVDNYFQEIKIDKQNVIGKEFIVNFPLALKGGEYTVRLIVKNNISEELGSYQYKLKIPNEIKGFAASDPKVFTSERSATVLFPESSGIMKAEAFFPHLPLNMQPVSGKKLYIDEDTIIYFSLVNYGMDVNKEQADVDTEFAMLHEGKVIKLALDIKKILNGSNKDVMTIIIKIPAGMLTTGRYNLRVFCKDNASGQILTKQVPLIFTARQKGKKADKAPSDK